MRTELTPDQIESYRDNGFLIYPDLLTAEQADELRAGVLDAISMMGKRKISDGLETGETEGFGIDPIEGEGFYDKVFIQRLNLSRLNDTVKRYMHATELGQMVAKLAGVDGIRIAQDQALIKEPFANATAFHLDVPLWHFHSRDAISIWIALDDVTTQNGCMYFLPGTHKSAQFDRNAEFGPQVGALLEVYPEWRGIEPVPVELKTGDCSFHNGMLAHGANANMTCGRRTAMTVAFMPDGCTFNGIQNILPNDYFTSLAPGDLLNNDDVTPLVYSS
jgi:phytanoyl-CoA hydroxylase